jgi:hypothetical protein
MSIDSKKSLDPKGSGPLHRPAASIDAGKTDTSNEGPIAKPSSGGMHETKPSPGNEAAGQTSKM